MTQSIRIYEVGPRDGLQNESRIIPTAAKIALIDLLSAAGFQKIEATSFVSPKWVPQLADAAEVMAGITRAAQTDYAVLTPNMRGFEAAKAAKADEVAVFASASEGFSRKNINCSIDESLARFAPVMAAAKSTGIAVRGYVSCVIDCPFDGAVAPAAAGVVVQQLLAMGCYEVSLGDTIGRGTPDQVRRLLDHLLREVPPAKLAGHFHDTGDRALHNVAAAVEMGLRSFDSAIGGLGGCPYAPGAKGNVSTRPLVTMLQERGFHTGIDTEILAEAEAYLARIHTMSA